MFYAHKTIFLAHKNPSSTDDIITYLWMFKIVLLGYYFCFCLVDGWWSVLITSPVNIDLPPWCFLSYLFLLFSTTSSPQCKLLIHNPFLLMRTYLLLMQTYIILMRTYLMLMRTYTMLMQSYLLLMQIYLLLMQNLPPINANIPLVNVNLLLLLMWIALVKGWATAC